MRYFLENSDILIGRVYSLGGYDAVKRRATTRTARIPSAISLIRSVRLRRRLVFNC